MCFRPHTPHQIVQAGADDNPEDMRPGERALARKVDRIGNLRVTHAHTGHASNLDAEVNSARIRDVNDRTKSRQLAGEIPVLVPAVQRKRLIEAKPMLSNGSHAEPHITSVSKVP